MITGTLGDTARRYGLVSRFFHWTIAYLVLWQLLMIAGWHLIGDGWFMRAVLGAGLDHGTIGFLVAIMIGPRFAWALANRRRRPPSAAGPKGLAARIAHRAMYLLVAIVSILPLVRAYGSGDGLTLRGVRVITATGVDHPMLVAPANMLHKPLAYGLAALIVLHVVAALLHGFVWGDGIVARMTGSLRGCSGTVAQ